MKEKFLLLIGLLCILSLANASSEARPQNKVSVIAAVCQHEYDTAFNASLNSLSEQIEQLLSKQKGHYSVAIKELDFDRKIVINNKRMRSASVIKIFVMIEAFRQAERNELNLNEKITLKNSMKVGGTGILQRMSENNRISYGRLIELMMIESDNTATNILISKLGMGKINQTAKDLGCRDTALVNLLMKKNGNQQGTVNGTSVGDLMLVLEEIYKNECLGPPYDPVMLHIMLQAKNRDKLPRMLPPDCLVAHKTGRISRHEHDAGIVFTENGDYIICVMSMNLPGAAEGEQVIGALSKLVYDYMQDYSLCEG